MKKLFQLSILFIIAISFSFYGFQCSSTELTSARLYIQQKNLDKAEDALKKEIAKNPQSEEGYFLMGYVSYEKKKYAEMQENFKKAASLGQKYANEIKGYTVQAWADNLNAGVSYFSQATKADDKEKQKEIMNKAIDHFQMAIKLQPDSAESYKNLAYSYLNIGEYEKAIEPMEKYTTKTESADAYKILSDLYLTKADQSFARYKESKDVKDSLEAMAEYKKIIALLDKAVVKYPANEDLNSKLLDSYIATGQSEFALQRMKAMYEANPNDKVLNFNYGTILMQLDKYEEATQYLKKAYQLDETYEPAIRNLVVCYYKWGMKVREYETEKEVENKTFRKYFQEVLPLINKLLELKPNDFKLYLILGDVYANLGDSAKAKEAYEKAEKVQNEGNK